MEKITFRPMTKKDRETVGELINQAFGLSRYVPEREALACLKKQYVYSCLAEATYHCVAEKDGEIIGVLMGNAKTDYRLLPHVPLLFHTLRLGIKMESLGRKGNSGVSDYKALHKIYRAFSNKHKGEFDGVLTLFAVNQACRGLGVGTKLLSGFLDYLKTQNTRRIYLYTDTTCNYGFYERNGFERLEDRPVSLRKDGKPFSMNVFLYGFSVLS